ncbi:unnamed protein product [Caenorhabditis bovis]|uniref:DUF19 domain-containing protein n=1 Tax=Caenorhabditis bovis TaxID=2654633 RepID=A0A8S1F148_9PELO|nr:unnamed protein product [Caenorhabditis bovis]
MTAILKFAAFAVLTVLCSAQFGTDQCNRIQFTACNSQLGDFWRADTTTAWKDLNTLDRIVTSRFVTPYTIDGFVSVCNGFSAFYGCLGQDQIRNCLGVVGQIGYGLSLNDSYAYMGFLADWDFKCGAGFWTIYERKVLASCVANTYVNYQQETGAALDTYHKASTAYPSNACTYAQDLMNSFQKIYQVGPCRTVNPAQAGWFGCQSAREWSNAQFTHCRHVTKCAFPTFRIVDGRAVQQNDAEWV